MEKRKCRGGLDLEVKNGLGGMKSNGKYTSCSKEGVWRYRGPVERLDRRLGESHGLADR